MKDVLTRLEADLDPAHPTAVTVLAYGEISAALLVPGLEGKVAKRMSGFADHRMARAYRTLVEDYIATVREVGIQVVQTDIIEVDRPGKAPVVYLVQPLLIELGNQLLHSASDAELGVAIEVVMDRVWTLHLEVPDTAIDAQLSNWSFADANDPVLLDVGTPFVRANGRYLFDQEILLSAIPPGLRAYYRRKGDVATYMDDYFDPRLAAVDLLGNFVKEGAVDRLPEAIVIVNGWLDAHGLASIDRAQVEAYYKQDAATLELFLRVRRLDRAARRLLRREYDFILPGRVSR